LRNWLEKLAEELVEELAEEVEETVEGLAVAGTDVHTLDKCPEPWQAFFVAPVSFGNNLFPSPLLC